GAAIPARGALLLVAFDADPARPDLDAVHDAPAVGALHLAHDLMWTVARRGHTGAENEPAEDGEREPEAAQDHAALRPGSRHAAPRARGGAAAAASTRSP